MLHSKESTAFGALLRQHRLAAGLTQAALAERSGVSERTLQDLERGASRPRQATVGRLIAALGLLPASGAELEAVSSAPRRRAREGRAPGAAASSRRRDRPPARLLDPPPVTSPAPRPNNLPIQPTALLGREHEVAEICALLRDGARLVTLTGPGGVGKTRVAIEVAAAFLDVPSPDSDPAPCVTRENAFVDGVFLVELAPLRDPELLPAAIVQALGLREPGRRTVLEGLKAYLHGRSLLLLLDNFEHVVTAAPLVAELLATGPGLRVLATSRAPLRLRGEREYGVSPLALPDVGASLSPAALARYAAVTLFVERAAEIRSEFALTDDTAASIAEICARLDGLPLAIELSAARVPHLSLAALRTRLASRLQVLTGGPRDLPARQQTLRDTIEWSHDLLDESERCLFRRLAVFVGGFTLEAAEAVCGDADVLDIDRSPGRSTVEPDAPPTAGPAVVDGVASLVEKNLVRFDPTANQPRYGMLESIREYGLEKLREGGEEAAIRGRHLLWLLALAERGAPLQTGIYSMADFERVGAELDNLRVALAWGRDRAVSAPTGLAEPDGTAPSPLQAALRLATAGYLQWFWRGALREGRAWIEQLLALDEASNEPESPARQLARMRALVIQGSMTFLSGEPESAIPLLLEGARRAASIGDVLAEYQVLVMRGGVALMEGQIERAIQLLEASLGLAHACASRHFVASSQYYIGEAALALGDLDRAEDLFEAAAAAARPDGVSWATAETLNALARVAALRGDHARAAALYREGLPARVRLDDRVGQVYTLEALAWQIAELGDAQRAAVLLGTTAALRDRYGLGQAGLPLVGSQRETALAATCAALDPATFKAAANDGRLLSAAEAVALALRPDRTPGGDGIPT